MDIGGTFMKYGLINEQLEIHDFDKVPTPDNLEDFEGVILGLLERFSDQIDGLAISMPGAVRTETGFVYHGGLIPYLKMIPLGKRLAEKTDLPIILMNDGDAAALGEAKYGNLRGVGCGGALVLGTGVGGALIIDGDLASDRQAKDGSFFQYRRVGQGVPKNDAQNLSVMERWALALNLYATGIDSFMRNAGSAVNFIKTASETLHLEEADGLKVFEEIKAGQNDELNRLFEQYCEEIAKLLLHFQGQYLLEKAVIGGGISAQEILLEGINRQYDRLLKDNPQFNNELDRIPVEACKFGNSANLLGAYWTLQDRLEGADQEGVNDHEEVTGLQEWFGNLFTATGDAEVAEGLKE